MTDYALQQVVNALSAGSLYALMAVGLAMVFGILRLINFAHGDVMMIAAYLAVFCLGAGLPLAGRDRRSWSSGTVVVGLLMERVAYRPLRGAPDVAMLLTSFAVGPDPPERRRCSTTRLAGKPTLIAFPSPEPLSGVVDDRARSRSPRSTSRASSPGIVLLGLLTRVRDADDARACRCGRRPRTSPAARLMGIKVNRVVATAFAIGAGLAAVAGLLYAVQAGQINPYMGFTPVLKAFIAAVIGGFGSIAGAVLGGYVLGFLEVLVDRAGRDRRPAAAGLGPARGPRASSRQWLPSSLASYRDAFVFVVLILVLLVRPQGHPRPARPRGDAVNGRRRAAGPRSAARPRCVDRRWRVLEASGQAFWQGLVDQPRDLHRS